MRKGRETRLRERQSERGRKQRIQIETSARRKDRGRSTGGRYRRKGRIDEGALKEDIGGKE